MMMRRVAYSSAVLAAALFGAGCAQTSGVPSASAPTTPAALTSPSVPVATNTPPRPNVPDACTFLTVAEITQAIGFDVGAGASQPSGMEGSTCIFSGSNGFVPDSVNIQLSPKPDAYYSDAAWEGAEDVTGYAEGKFRSPQDGSASAAIKKNGKLAFVTAYASKGFSKDQFVALLKAVAGKL